MLYVIRHLPVVLPEVLNNQSVCYGRTDLPAQKLTDNERKEILQRLPAGLAESYKKTLYITSPLLRCRQLASELFLDNISVRQDSRLEELNFGEWEMQPWSEISRASLDEWAGSPQSYMMPGGESFDLLIKRVSQWFDDVRYEAEKKGYENIIVIAHAGVAKALQIIMKTKNLDEVLQSSLGYGKVLILPLSPIN